jgi:hypothetical protein
MASLFRDWQIRNLDTGAILNPPYPMTEEGVTLDGIGGNITEQSRFGFEDTLLQWTSGRTKGFTFSTVLYSEHSEDDIMPKFAALKKLSKKDPDLERQPICIFSIGKVLSETCMVSNVDVRIAPPTAEQTAKLIELTISLKKYKPFSQVQVDPNKPSKESYYLVVSAAEASYEALARRWYGDPMKGDRLRKRHPDMPLMPSVGARISIPPKSVILAEPVVPSFHALSLTDEDATKNFEDIAEVRNGYKVVMQ